MFPLIAISAFFILGIAFFAIGKDDFGIKKIKEDLKDTPPKDNEGKNPQPIARKETTEGNDEVKADPLQDKEFTENISD